MNIFYQTLILSIREVLDMPKLKPGEKIVIPPELVKKVMPLLYKIVVRAMREEQMKKMQQEAK
mgnify:CR=1 FL=1